MLRWVVDEVGWNWNLHLPYVLFDIQEIRQASTGLMPFEQHPRGRLDGAQEAWEEQPSPFHSLVDYEQEMQEQINWVILIVCEYM